MHSREDLRKRGAFRDGFLRLFVSKMGSSPGTLKWKGEFWCRVLHVQWLTQRCCGRGRH